MPFNGEDTFLKRGEGPLEGVAAVVLCCLDRATGVERPLQSLQSLVLGAPLWGVLSGALCGGGGALSRGLRSVVVVMHMRGLVWFGFATAPAADVVATVGDAAAALDPAAVGVAAAALVPAAVGVAAAADSRASALSR